jgi:hypothetical protein
MRYLGKQAGSEVEHKAKDTRRTSSHEVEKG